MEPNALRQDRPPRRAGVVAWFRAAGANRAMGFTLIELLVVISIIGVLVGITLPSLAGARNQARRLKCLTHLKGFGVSFELYRNDNRELLPYVLPFYDIGSPGGPPGGNSPSLLSVLDPYIDVPPPYYDQNNVLQVYAPYLCPSDTDDDAGRTLGFSYQYWAGGLMLLREQFGESARTVAATVTRFYEQNPQFAILADAKQWHPGGVQYNQNALYFGDWRADWLKLDPLGRNNPPLP